MKKEKPIGKMTREELQAHGFAKIGDAIIPLSSCGACLKLFAIINEASSIMIPLNDGDDPKIGHCPFCGDSDITLLTPKRTNDRLVAISKMSNEGKLLKGICPDCYGALPFDYTEERIKEIKDDLGMTDDEDLFDVCPTCEAKYVPAPVTN